MCRKYCRSGRGCAGSRYIEYVICVVCCRGVFIRRPVLMLLLMLVLVSVTLIVMMMVVAIRQQSITGSTQGCSHGQLAVKFDIRSGSHIDGRRELTKGIGKVESVMLSMLMRTHRRCRSTHRAVVRQMNCYCLQRCWAERKIVRMEPLNTIKCRSLGCSG